MADPYNPYTSYSTPTPGAVNYYPTEDQTHQPPPYPYQQPYGSTEPQPQPNYSPYHLAPEPYQSGAPERSYTPVRQPDYLGPVTPAAMPPIPAQSEKVPGNISYYWPTRRPITIHCVRIN